MNQPNNLSRSPNPKIRIPIDEDFPSPLPAHIRCHLLEFPCRRLSLDFEGRLRDFILVQPTGVRPPP